LRSNSVFEKGETVQKVEPRVFLIGETRIIEEGLSAYLEHLGVPEWTSDAPTDVEEIIEVMARGCYKSFGTSLNPNITRIREHNDEYMANILRVAHGSVIEHPVLNFMLSDVSRVFTHELVRHRAGVAISQESLRFVRLTDIGMWLPLELEEDEVAYEVITSTVKVIEDAYAALVKYFGLDEEGKGFKEKKKWTSRFRRIAPMGTATSIGWSANPRTIRWVMENRTAPGAEEEIRLVFNKLGDVVTERYPNLFQDFTKVNDDGETWEPERDGPLFWWKPAHSKV